ncbi:beta-alanine-activating enzyme isoform X3 [Drosophila eugracilis]|uniref:beta-alanine-activating enzyme isoform X3 n=1 Tax=Drosophila eugracilis TaxID=29029 RepID=UPI001BD92327|nr:beta-alanine-activating enzyme isoform X3 [Drosophila eugracilis]
METDGTSSKLAADSPPEDHRTSQNSEIMSSLDKGSKESTLENQAKLYDINRLRLFKDVPFLIRRMEPQDMTLTYDRAVEQVQILLNMLQSNNVPAGAGIALRITEHTPASSLLILAILNHKCHFFPTDKMLLSQELYEQMGAAGVDYLFVNKHLAVGSLNFLRLSTILVLDEDCKLYKVKHKVTDSAVKAKKPLPANMCYTITTTGSTGKPKVIHVPYECIAPNILALSQKLNVSMADIIYLGTPCTFDPFVVEFFLALQNGATLLTSRHSMKESPSKVLSALFPDNLSTPGITILQMTPSLFRQFGATSIKERVLNRSSSLSTESFSLAVNRFPPMLSWLLGWITMSFCKNIFATFMESQSYPVGVSCTLSTHYKPLCLWVCQLKMIWFYEFNVKMMAKSRKESFFWAVHRGFATFQK